MQPRRIVVAAGGWLALGIGLVACSALVEPSEKQCEVDADCIARGFIENTCRDNVCIQGKWACLGNVPEPVETPGATHIWSGRLIDIATREPPPDLNVKLCSNPDVECTNPLADGVPVASDGAVELVVPSGFEGYVELTSEAIAPAILSLGPPIVEDVVDVAPVELLPPGTVETLAVALDLPFNPMRGQALVLHQDCDANPSAGMVLSADTADQETLVLYIAGDLPDPNLTATLENGNAGIFNVPLGFTTLTSTRQDTGEAVGSNVIFMRAGFLTYVSLAPTSNP